MKAKTEFATWCVCMAMMCAFAWVGCNAASNPEGGDNDGATSGGDTGGPAEDGGGTTGDTGGGADGGQGAYCKEDRDCSDPTLAICDTARNECVECMADGDCAGGTCTGNACVAKGCAQHAECDMGKICKDNGCVDGCEDATQCPPADNANAVKCNPTFSATGKCVECLQKSDCPGAFADCDVTTWACVKTGCTIDTDCTDAAAPYCDTTDGKCYQCVSDGQCDAAFQCTDHVCVARPTGDCTIDNPPCARQTDGCDPATKKCFTKCYQGGICLQGTCDAGTQLCFPCVENKNCNGQVCDTAAHECIACTDTAQCGGTLQCDTGAGNCVECLVKADCMDAALPSCNDDGRCVACVADGDCVSPAKCDQKYFKCTDVTGIDACKACALDAECGSGKFCVHHKQGAKFLEHVCAWTCGSDAECDKGFACQDVGDPSHKVCYPSYGGGTFTPTCAGMKSIGTMSCNDQTNPCTTTGADPQDAQCFAYQQYSICTVPCTTDNDCPGSNICRTLMGFSLCSPF